MTQMRPSYSAMGIANAGDQNNDGFEDLLVKWFNNDIYLFYGADNGP